MNKIMMKEEGGIIGLTQDSDALLRWAVAGPELVRVISEFEESMIGKRERETLDREITMSKRVLLRGFSLSR